MKNSFFNCLIVAICMVILVGCGGDDKSQKPSCLKISGRVTDESGNALNSIQVYIDSASLNSINETCWNIENGYTNSDGLYRLSYMCGGRLTRDNWPAEISVTARDTSNTFEPQAQNFTINVVERTHRTTDAFVTADFVMKKK